MKELDDDSPTVIGIAREVPSLADVQQMIDRLDRRDREMLRVWLIARYDASGDLERTVAKRER